MEEFVNDLELIRLCKLIKESASGFSHYIEERLDLSSYDDYDQLMEDIEELLIDYLYEEYRLSYDEIMDMIAYELNRLFRERSANFYVKVAFNGHLYIYRNDDYNDVWLKRGLHDFEYEYLSSDIITDFVSANDSSIVDYIVSEVLLEENWNKFINEAIFPYVERVYEEVIKWQN
jgi:hypothetical protein